MFNGNLDELKVIVPDTGRPYYLPGETIAGKMVATCSGEAEVNSMGIELKGWTIIRWKENVRYSIVV